MAVILKCKYCEKKFRWDAGADKWPDECPLCAADISQPPGDGVVMPFISLSKNKAADRVYREMESGAEHRINVAAEMTGQPKADFSGLKITDMKDNLRAGDIAAPSIPSNPVSQAMQATPKAWGFQGHDAAGISAGTQAGPYPNVGAKMQTVVREHHASHLGANAGMSDNPSTEFLSPNYRRRG